MVVVVVTGGVAVVLIHSGNNFVKVE